MEWYDTSQGVRARLSLLPGNPHFDEDVCTIRKNLLLPPDHMKISTKDEQVNELKHSMLFENIQEPHRTELAKRTVEGNLAGWWLQAHRMVASSSKDAVLLSDIKKMIPVELYRSAVNSAAINLALPDVPEWLHRQPVKSKPNAIIISPIDWATMKILKRYKLPDHIKGNIPVYVLTQDKYRITGLEPLNIKIGSDGDGGNCTDEDAFDISLQGIDEFVTEADWNRIWHQYVTPLQQRLLQDRGMDPQGRRSIDLSRLERLLPAYQEMVKSKLEINDMICKLGNISPVQKLGFFHSISDLDQETIRRAISSLRILLRPQPDVPESDSYTEQ
jgi:hypothetical protein